MNKEKMQELNTQDPPFHRPGEAAAAVTSWDASEGEDRLLEISISQE